MISLNPTSNRTARHLLPAETGGVSPLDENMQYQEKLASLKNDYQKMLPKRLEEISQAWKKVSQENSEDQLEELCRLVHSLAGSGSTFGYSLLSSVAKETEVILRQIQEKKVKLDTFRKTEVDGLLNDLSKATDTTDDTDASGAMEMARLRLGSRTMSQHIFWYGKDGSLAGKMRNQLYQYGFQVHLFEVIPDLINRLKEEMPSALVFDFYEAGGHFRDTVEIDRILTQVAPKTPFICIAPPGEDLVNWLAAYRAGASTCFPRPIQFFDILDRLDRILEKQSESPYRVFMIDDDENLMEHMSLILKKTGMEVHYETKPGAALKALPEFKPDLILLDLYMPQISGMELSHIIRQDNRWLTVPIVFLSRETEVAKQLEALDKGGDDFLLKPVKYRFLYHSLSSRIKRARVLRSYLTRDALTGLLNHTVLQEHLEDFVSGETNHFVFAIVDIDNFKALNDRMGHQIGDQLLKSLAILLKRHLGKDALVGRFGGEEFGVILKDVSTSEAQAMLEGIRQNFNQIVHETDDDSFQQTFSCGYAAYPQFNTVTTLIDGAEKALSQAKSMGKNMVQTAVPMFRSEKTPDAPDLPDEDLIILDDGDDLVDLDTGQIDADLVSASDNINITTVVVDDDPQVLQHISTVMLEKGFQVYQAANGEEGYKLAERYKPDLILIDLLLFPGIHGFELCQKVRELLPDIRIILMTAVYKDYRYRLEGKEAGADDFIEKPINYPVLLDKIKTLLPEAVV